MPSARLAGLISSLWLLIPSEIPATTLLPFFSLVSPLPAPLSPFRAYEFLCGVPSVRRAG